MCVYVKVKKHCIETLSRPGQMLGEMGIVKEYKGRVNAATDLTEIRRSRQDRRKRAKQTFEYDQDRTVEKKMIRQLKDLSIDQPTLKPVRIHPPYLASALSKEANKRDVTLHDERMLVLTTKPNSNPLIRKTITFAGFANYSAA